MKIIFLVGFTCILLCVVETRRWNKFVNPFQNFSRHVRSTHQPKTNSWMHDQPKHLNWFPPYRRKYVFPSRYTLSHSRMYSDESPFWQPSKFGDSSLVWKPEKPSIADWTEQVSPKEQASPRTMVWNEHGQYWGYAPQTDERTLTNEELLWAYGSQPALMEDTACIPPFCIPIDCEGNRKCRSYNPPKCVEDKCKPKCTSPHSCPPNDSACPLGHFGPRCAVINSSTCLERYSLHCNFGCTNFEDNSRPAQCVCGTNNTDVSCVSMEAFVCPMGCSGHGNCDTRSKICDCFPGYSGLGCEHEKLCPTGMTGPECKLDIDECLSGASGCSQRCVNTYGSYRCECDDGYHTDPSDRRNCVPNIQCQANCTQNQGICNESNVCVCNPGFRGESCSEDIDECYEGSHKCEQICINTLGSYECRCYPGYIPDALNSKWCKMIGCRPVCVQDQGTCNEDGQCVCKPGFTGADCSLDVDECVSGSHQCAQICVNTHGSFYCACHSGHRPDPNNPNACLKDSCDPMCQSDIGSCVGRYCVHGVCRERHENRSSVFRCECIAGYEGDHCDKDIDECLTGSHHCDQLCYNTPGSYICGCRSGFVLNSDGRKCESNGCGKMCQNGGVCQATGKCTCPPNYAGTHCEFIKDRCKEIRGCEQLCLRDENGEFRCACQPGYQLAADERSCLRSSPCKPACQNGAQCFRGRCLCKSGFEGVQCELDKDECRLPAAVHGCTYECLNTYGSYECQCPPEYHRLADKRTCVRSPTGTNCNPPCQNGAVCRPGNHCECLRGYRGVDCSQEIDECKELNPCDLRFAQCVNKPGGFECLCRDGYRLMVDGRHCIDENRAKNAPHLVFRGRGQKGIVLASRTEDAAAAQTQIQIESHQTSLRNKRSIQRQRRRAKSQPTTLFHAFKRSAFNTVLRKYSA